MHQLAHGIGNYLETHGWPEARYSAQQYWVRPEFLTDTQSAFKVLFTLQDLLNRLLSALLICHAVAHIGMCVLIQNHDFGTTSDSKLHKHNISMHISQQVKLTTGC